MMIHELNTKKAGREGHVIILLCEMEILKHLREFWIDYWK